MFRPRTTRLRRVPVEPVRPAGRGPSHRHSDGRATRPQRRSSRSARRRVRRASRSSSKASISSRRRRTSASWRSRWPRASLEDLAAAPGSSARRGATPRRRAARASSAATSSLSSSSVSPSSVACSRSALAQALDVRARRRRGARRRSRSPARRQQPDLLVVADRPRRGAGTARRPRRCAGRAADRARSCRHLRGGDERTARLVGRPQERDDGAEQRGRRQHPQRRVHVLDEGIELAPGRGRS